MSLASIVPKGLLDTMLAKAGTVLDRKMCVWLQESTAVEGDLWFFSSYVICDLRILVRDMYREKERQKERETEREREKERKRRRENRKRETDGDRERQTETERERREREREKDQKSAPGTPHQGYVSYVVTATVQRRLRF